MWPSCVFPFCRVEINVCNSPPLIWPANSVPPVGSEPEFYTAQPNERSEVVALNLGEEIPPSCSGLNPSSGVRDNKAAVGHPLILRIVRIFGRVECDLDLGADALRLLPAPPAEVGQQEVDEDFVLAVAEHEKPGLDHPIDRGAVGVHS